MPTLNFISTSIIFFAFTNICWNILWNFFKFHKIFNNDKNLFRNLHHLWQECQMSTKTDTRSTRNEKFPSLEKVTMLLISTIYPISNQMTVKRRWIEGVLENCSVEPLKNKQINMFMGSRNWIGTSRSVTRHRPCLVMLTYFVKRCYQHVWVITFQHVCSFTEMFEFKRGKYICHTHGMKTTGEVLIFGTTSSVT